MSLLSSSKTMDMTQGPLLGKIIRFTLPLIATNLLQECFNAADIMIAGMSKNPDAMGAVGSTSAFLNMIIYIFIGISAGTDVIVARRVGAKDSEGISRSVHTSMCMSVIFGLIACAVGMLLTDTVLTSMGYTGNLMALSKTYTYIFLAGMPFMSMTNFLSAIMRAKGDAKTPMYVLSGAGLLNVLLNLFFVFVLDLTVEGVAIASLISNLAATSALWICLSREEGPCRLSFSKLKIDWNTFKKICIIGLPAGAQNSLISMSNILIQSSILQVNNDLAAIDSAYAPVVRGNTAAQSVETFIYSVLNSIVHTSIVFTGQNVGVGDYKRVKKVFFTILLMISVATVFMSAVAITFHETFLSFFGVFKGGDELADITYSTAIKRVSIKWPTFIIFALMNTASGVLRGLGRSVSSAVISLIGMCGYRIIWIIFVFAAFPTLETVYISFPISWSITGIALFVLLGITLRKKIREQNALLT